MLYYLQELISSDSKFLIKFDKKIGVPVLFELLVHKNKQVKEQSQAILSEIVEQHKWKLLVPFKKNLKSNVLTAVEEFHRAYILSKKTTLADVTEKIQQEVNVTYTEEPVFRDLKKVVGSRFKDIASLESFNHLALQFLRIDVFSNLYDTDEAKQRIGLQLILKQIQEDEESCLLAWGFVCKICGLIASYHKTLETQNLLQEILVHLTDVRQEQKEKMSKMSPSEMWCAAEFLINLIRFKIRENREVFRQNSIHSHLSSKLQDDQNFQELCLLFEQMIDLTEEKSREFDYFHSAFKQLDYEIYRQYLLDDLTSARDISSVNGSFVSGRNRKHGKSILSQDILGGIPTMEHTSNTLHKRTQSNVGASSKNVAGSTI